MKHDTHARARAGERNRLSVRGRAAGDCLCVERGFSFLQRSGAGAYDFSELDFVRLASYGEGMKSGGTVSFTKDIELSLEANMFSSLKIS